MNDTLTNARLASTATTANLTVAPADLLSAALGGDGGAYRKLVEPHLSMLHRVACRVCRNSELAHDVVQDTLTLAFQKLHKYRTEASFKGFLAGIAVRQAYTQSRSEMRRRRREIGSKEPQRPSTPEEILRGEHMLNRIRVALENLPDKRRKVAVLRLDGALSYQEIAQIVGTSERSARVLVHMAIKELRESLSDLVQP